MIIIHTGTACLDKEKLNERYQQDCIYCQIPGTYDESMKYDKDCGIPKNRIRLDVPEINQYNRHWTFPYEEQKDLKNVEPKDTRIILNNDFPDDILSIKYWIEQQPNTNLKDYIILPYYEHNAVIEKAETAQTMYEEYLQEIKDSTFQPIQTSENKRAADIAIIVQNKHKQTGISAKQFKKLINRLIARPKQIQIIRTETEERIALGVATVKINRNETEDRIRDLLQNGRKHIKQHRYYHCTTEECAMTMYVKTKK